MLRSDKHHQIDYKNFRPVYTESERLHMVATTTHLYRSIHAQPDAIRVLLHDWEMPEQAAQKLVNAGRILLAGIGTSYHAALIGEYLLRSAGADAWAIRSFEFVNYPRPLRDNDAVIVISHRGSKLFGARALQRSNDAHILTIGISGKNTNMQGADLLLETVDQDPSSTHSISYTAALTRLAQVAARLAALNGHNEVARQLEQGLQRLPTLMENILTREDTLYQTALEAVQQQRRLVFVGAGPNAPTAFEGALKAKEAAYVTAEGFELEQFIHGPLVAFEATDLLIPICVKGPTQPRLAELLTGISEIGAPVLLLGDFPSEEASHLFQQAGWNSFTLSHNEQLPEELTPLLAAVPVQLLADFLATARGTKADSFRKDQEIYNKACSHIPL
jgi:glutamine---fructose-6-phosphate transaminase (isomerizing)